MIKRFIFYACVLINLFMPCIHTQSTSTSSEQIETLAAFYFNSYPTNSINSDAVDSLFGSLNVDTTTINYIKSTYFYLEYITKMELAARIFSLAESLNIDAVTTVEDSSWEGLVSEVNAATGSFKNTVEQARASTIVPDYTVLQTNIGATYWSDIPNTSFWNAFEITTDDIMQSEMWQDYLKYTIIQSFVQDVSLLEQIKTSEEMMFKYIPNIEIAYYESEFTSIRNSAELIRISLLLVDNARDRAIKDCIDWQALDLPSTYSATADFTSTPFFKVLYEMQQTETGQSTITTSTGQSFITEDEVATDPLILNKVVCYNQIKLVQQLLDPLYTSENLESTMNALSSTTGPAPSFLVFNASDSPFLEDRNTIIETKNAESSSTITTAVRTPLLRTPQTYDPLLQVASWDDFVSALSSAGDAIVSGVEAAGEGALSLAEGIGYSVAGVGEDVAAFFVSWVDPETGKELALDASEFWTSASESFDDVRNDVNEAIYDIGEGAEIAVDTLSAGGGYFVSSFGSLIGSTELENLGSDLTMTLSTLSATIFDGLEGAATFVADTYMSPIQFSAEGATLVGSAIVDTVIAARTGDTSIYSDDFLASAETYATDIVSSILGTITLTGSYALETFEDLTLTIAYIASAIVDIQYATMEAFTYASAFVVSGFDPASASAAVASVEEALESKRKVMTAIDDVAVTIALTIATGGLFDVAVGAEVAADAYTIAVGGTEIAIDVTSVVIVGGLGVFQIIGGEQADEADAAMLLEQQEFVDAYEEYVADSKTMIEAQMEDYEKEFNAKFKLQVSNQERGLGFYQNFMNTYFESIKASMASTLGQYLSQQLVPDENGLVYADVGALYGLSTGVYNFNPSQGFPLYNMGRTAFSQEVAVAPALAVSGSGDATTISTEAAPEKFWFNQKETIPLDTPVTEFEVKLRGIYLLDSYYIGLYFGGVNYNIEDIIETKTASVDPANLAKMLVYKKPSGSTSTTSGLYEHEGLGWLSESLTSPEFQPGTWYHMKMQLNGSVLTVKIWEDGQTEPSGQTFTVTIDEENPPQTVGIISSGAAIEYQIITPEVTITTNDAVRIEPTSPFEKAREITARQTMNRLQSPQLGTLNLEALDLTTILKGQYIYTTQDTQLTDTQQNVIDDYVVLCQIDNNQVAASSIGISLETTGASGIISLLTGKYYDIDAAEVGYYDDILSVYNLYHGPLNDAVYAQIINQRELVLSEYVGPFTFGTITLEATSLSDVASGFYIYKATSPASELIDDDGNPLVDETSGQTLYDYFVMATLSGVYPASYGIPYTEDVDGIVSLVTGNVYSRDSTTPISNGYTSLLTDYQSTFGTLPTELVDAITAAQTYYASQVTLESKQTVPSEDDTSMSDPTGPVTGDQSVIPPAVPETGADESMAQNQADASGGEISTSGF